MDFQTRYEFNPKTDLLGKGGFSKVYKANDTLLDRTVALKFFTGNGSEKYQVLNEIKKVIRFEHPNLCKYYDVAVLTGKNVMGETETIEVGIMEYLDAGNFKSYIKNNPQYIDKLLIDVLRGLSYLHKRGIVHRDLKPQNIIVKIVDDEPVAKITDFGISKLINADDDNSSVLIGTIEYMAPEQFNPKKYGTGGRITTNLDLWSFGLLVYEALQQKPLFGSRSSGTSAEQVMRNILSNSYLPKTEALPLKYRSIAKKCLVKYASERVQNALELIPLFDEEYVSPKKIIEETNSRDHDNKSNTDTKNDSPLNEAVPVQTPILQPEEEEFADLTEVIDHEEDVAALNEEPLESADDESESNEDEPVPDEPHHDIAQVSVTGNKISDDNPGYVQFSQELSGESNANVHPSDEEVHADGTQPIGLADHVTNEHTQILEIKEDVSGEFTQILKNDEFEVNDDQTGVIQLGQNLEDLNTSLPEPKQSLPENEGLFYIDQRSEEGTGKSQDLFKRMRTFPFKKNQTANLTLYAMIPVLLIIGFFVVSHLNSSDKPVVPKKIVFDKKTPAVEQPALLTVPKLVKVDGGDYTMGNENPEAAPSELPAHKVHLSDFYIGKYEVTIYEFGQFIKDSKYITTAELEEKSEIFKNGHWASGKNVNWRHDINGNIQDTLLENTPVVHVSWLDAKKYCEWLSIQAHKTYRLPTEAEWEFAARGGNNSKHFIYSGSNNINDVAWFQGNSANKIQKVGQKQPNELGVYDMSGNVLEWCNDWYDQNYYRVSSSDNPPGPLTGTTHVVRGGSWFLRENTWFRNSFRAGFPPDIRGGQLGFRICQIP